MQERGRFYKTGFYLSQNPIRGDSTPISITVTCLMANNMVMVTTYSKNMDQPGKVAYPARGQLNRENSFSLSPFTLRIWSRGTGSAVPSGVGLLISILRLNLVLTYWIPPNFSGDIHLFIQTTIRHRVSLEFIRSPNCVPMVFTAESPSAQGQ